MQNSLGHQSLKQFVTFLKSSGLEGLRKYYSVYIGVVRAVDEEAGNNRLWVSIPEVFGLDRLAPALPRGVPSGKGWGYNFVPKAGEVVFITFRYGSPRFPLWEPGFFAKGEKPEEFTPDVIGHKYRDGAISIYNESDHEFKVLTPNNTLISHKDDTVTIMVPDGITFVIEKGNFEFSLANGDSFKYSEGAFEAKLSSGPSLELGSSGFKLSGNGTSQHAVLGEPLVNILTTFLSAIDLIVSVLATHDGLLGAPNSTQITTISSISESLSSSLNNILAT